MNCLFKAHAHPPAFHQPSPNSDSSPATSTAPFCAAQTARGLNQERRLFLGQQLHFRPGPHTHTHTHAHAHQHKQLKSFHLFIVAAVAGFCASTLQLLPRGKFQMKAGVSKVNLTGNRNGSSRTKSRSRSIRRSRNRGMSLVAEQTWPAT